GRSRRSQSRGGNGLPDADEGWVQQQRVGLVPAAAFEQGAVMRTVGWCVSVAVAALLTGCEKYGPDSSSGVKRSDASARGEGSPPVEVVTPSGIAMIYLPGGAFLMGSDKGNADEAPAHQVTVSPFLIDKFEVTHAIFAKAQLPNPSHWQDHPKKPV